MKISYQYEGGSRTTFSELYEGICPICKAKAVGSRAEPRGNAMQIPFTCTDCGLRWTFTTSACAFSIATKYHNERVGVINVASKN